MWKVSESKKKRNREVKEMDEDRWEIKRRRKKREGKRRRDALRNQRERRRRWGTTDDHFIRGNSVDMVHFVTFLPRARLPPLGNSNRNVSSL